MVDSEQVLAAYVRAWGHREEPDIRGELERCWTPDSTYVNPLTDVIRGLEGLVSLILDLPVIFPGAEFRPTSPADIHHDVAYFTWRLTSSTRIRMLGRDYGTTVDGVDFVQFAPDGHIRRINAFFGVDHRLGRPDPAANGATRDRTEAHAVLDLDLDLDVSRTALARHPS